jgi:hypothetical protein
MSKMPSFSTAILGIQIITLLQYVYFKVLKLNVKTVYTNVAMLRSRISLVGCNAMLLRLRAFFSTWIDFKKWYKLKRFIN